MIVDYHNHNNNYHEINFIIRNSTTTGHEAHAQNLSLQPKLYIKDLRLAQSFLSVLKSLINSIIHSLATRPSSSVFTLYTLILCNFQSLNSTLHLL